MGGEGFFLFRCHRQRLHTLIAFILTVLANPCKGDMLPNYSIQGSRVDKL
jgi:hypothetical protein